MDQPDHPETASMTHFKPILFTAAKRQALLQQLKDAGLPAHGFEPPKEPSQPTPEKHMAAPDSSVLNSWRSFVTNAAKGYI